MCHLPLQDVQELNRVLCDKLEEKVRRAAGGGRCGVALSVRRAPAERVCRRRCARGSGAGRAIWFMDMARDILNPHAIDIHRARSFIVARDST